MRCCRSHACVLESTLSHGCQIVLTKRRQQHVKSSPSSCRSKSQVIQEVAQMLPRPPASPGPVVLNCFGGQQLQKVSGSAICRPAWQRCVAEFGWRNGRKRRRRRQRVRPSDANGEYKRPTVGGACLICGRLDPSESSSFPTGGPANAAAPSPARRRHVARSSSIIRRRVPLSPSPSVAMTTAAVVMTTAAHGRDNNTLRPVSDEPLSLSLSLSLCPLASSSCLAVIATDCVNLATFSCFRKKTSGLA